MTLLISLIFSFYAYSCENTGEPNACHHGAPPEVSDHSRRVARRFERDMEDGRLRERTNGALDAMIRLGAHKLRKAGHKKEAKKLLDEWDNQYRFHLLRRDLGDHKPLSQWLKKKYEELEALLGPEVCHALRLDDIKIINFGIPVVFSCVDDVDELEYSKHFVPLAGTVIYWTTFFSCVGFTWGTGFLYCSPLSWGAEFLTEKYIAPRLNEPIWKLSCHQEELSCRR